MTSKPLPVPMVLNQRNEWFEAANAGMDALIARGNSFTADDLRDMIPAPASDKWQGALFKGYQSMKLIKPVGYEQSRSASRKSGVLRRWAPVVTRG